VTLNVNGRDVPARKGDMVISAALLADEYVPHFCYHPRMSPVGMCRQCMVEVEGPRGPMMVVSCMTPVADGQVVRTDTPQVKRAQEGMLELLLANHPLDCPVCDKGGECPLQDQAYSHGPGESRYVEEKRHFEKPIPISDLVLLDRERCILCDRCTRFADEVAGDKLIHFISRGNDTQVMTFPDEPFVSYFSGNTVQICPVGALTAKPYRFAARPWDLSKRESTCTTCSVGCRMVIQSSRDELLRYQGVDSDPVNWGWLCDRGRFNFEAVNSDHRLGAPMVKSETGLVPASWNVALRAAASLVTEALAEGGPDSIGLLGGARGSNEDAFAWAQLADSIGITYRDAQFGDGLPAEILGLDRATIDDAAHAATVILLGPDLKEELPVLYLRLRDAADKKRTRIIEFSTLETGMSPYAWKSIRYEPGTQQAAVAKALADADIAEQLGTGNVVVVAGRPNLAESAEATVAALQTILDGCPADHRAAGAAARQRRRCTLGRTGTCRHRTRRPVHAACRRRGQARAAGAARRRPAQRLPRRRPRPPSDRRRPSRALDRHLRLRVHPARRRRARRGRLRRESRDDHQHRRSRVDARAAGHRHRHEPTRLDDRRRTGPADRRPLVRSGPSAARRLDGRRRHRTARVDRHRPSPRSPPPPFATSPTACSRRRRRPRCPRCLSPHRVVTAMTIDWW
jgi:NADH-quinone oxidoreductase chain G